ncbi:MAG: hypothetical protein GY945_09855 [Rhodobacteraceae bacterium]|nr:hypothetical protein [Paracoccaceae bacterium]
MNDAFPVEGVFIDDNLQVLQSLGASATALTAWAGTGTALGNTIPLAPTRVTGIAGWDNRRGVDAMSATIQRAAVLNEWSSNPGAGVQTDWVVTFPTKYFYVDQGPARQFAIITADRPESEYATGGVGGPAVHVPYPPFAEAFSTVQGGNPTDNGTRIGGESCNRVSFARFDRSENSAETSGGVIISPAPAAATDDLCFEANVLTFNGGDVLGAADPVDVDTTPIPGDEPFGWMQLRLDEDPAAKPDTIVVLDDDVAAGTVMMYGGLGAGTMPGVPMPGATPAADDYYGLPVIGYMVKQRTFGAVNANYASSLDHAYQRRADYRQVRGAP